MASAASAQGGVTLSVRRKNGNKRYTEDYY